MKRLLLMLAISFNGMVLANGEEFAVEFVKSIEEVEGYIAMMRELLPEASCSEAKEILNGYIKVLAKYKDNEKTPFHGKVFFGDKAVTLIRIANVLEVQGNSSEANKYRAEARIACEKAQWSSCEEVEIDRVVGEMNKELEIGCKRKGHAGT